MPSAADHFSSKSFRWSARARARSARTAANAAIADRVWRRAIMPRSPAWITVAARTRSFSRRARPSSHSTSSFSVAAHSDRRLSSSPSVSLLSESPCIALKLATSATAERMASKVTGPPSVRCTSASAKAETTSSMQALHSLCSSVLTSTARRSLSSLHFSTCSSSCDGMGVPNRVRNSSAASSTSVKAQRLFCSGMASVVSAAAMISDTAASFKISLWAVKSEIVLSRVARR
mmetsp:Transcript_30625/g.91769  ORF Transcript_30625/g.91769 Transcript_30625/m.91769 type:complete len:233 (+) Transcript_30625:2191-2889(+)